MATIKKADLEKAAKELNLVLGLDPKIDVKAAADSIKEQILEAYDLIEEEDELTQATWDVINALLPEEEDLEDEEQDLEDEEQDLEDEEEDLEDEEEATVAGNKVIKMQPQKQDPEDDDGDLDYSEMTLEELQQLCKDRGIKFKKKDEEEDLIELLEDWDAENEEDTEDVNASEEEEEAPAKKGKAESAPAAPAKEDKKPKEKASAPAPAPKAKEKAAKPARERITKKSIVEKLLASKKGATIEEMGQAIVDAGIDDDFAKNCKVAKLWLAKMGYDTTKDAIAINPVFKKR